MRPIQRHLSKLSQFALVHAASGSSFYNVACHCASSRRHSGFQLAALFSTNSFGYYDTNLRTPRRSGGPEKQFGYLHVLRALDYYSKGDAELATKFLPLFNQWWHQLSIHLPSMKAMDALTVILALKDINWKTGAALRHWLTRGHIALLEDRFLANESLLKRDKVKTYYSLMIGLLGLYTPSDSYAAVPYPLTKLLSTVLINVTTTAKSLDIKAFNILATFLSFPITMRATIGASEAQLITCALHRSMENIVCHLSEYSEFCSNNSPVQEHAKMPFNDFLRALMDSSRTAGIFLTWKLNPEDLLVEPNSITKSELNHGCNSTTFWASWSTLTKLLLQLYLRDLVAWDNHKDSRMVEVLNIASSLYSECFELASEFESIPELFNLRHLLSKVIEDQPADHQSKISRGNIIALHKAMDKFSIKSKANAVEACIPKDGESAQSVIMNNTLALRVARRTRYTLWNQCTAKSHTFERIRWYDSLRLVESARESSFRILTLKLKK